MRKLIQTDLALNDLRSIWSYIAKEDSNAATRMLEKIDARVRLLAKFPSLGEIGERVCKDCRRIIVGNYLVFYSFHASRRIEDLLLG